jgi:threonine dehydrogenase-like Zn-dependent dehydrogenase
MASQLQRELLVEQALGRADLRALRESAERPGFVHAAVELVSELGRAEIEPERFGGALDAWAGGGPRRAYARDVARAMGAAETIAMDDHTAIIARVMDLTGGALCDRVIEAVGKQGPLDLAAELTRERGRLIVAGYHQDGPRQVNMQLWNWRGFDVVNAHERNPNVYIEGMRDAVNAIASGHLDPRPLYTHTYPLNRLDEALNATRDRPDGFLKALVTC